MFMRIKANAVLRAKLREIADSLSDDTEFYALGIVLSGEREIVSACVKPSNSEVTDDHIAKMVARGLLKEARKPPENLRG